MKDEKMAKDLQKEEEKKFTEEGKRQQQRQRQARSVSQNQATSVPRRTSESNTNQRPFPTNPKDIAALLKETVERQDKEVEEADNRRRQEEERTKQVDVDRFLKSIEQNGGIYDSNYSPSTSLYTRSYYTPTYTRSNNYSPSTPTSSSSDYTPVYSNPIYTAPSTVSPSTSRATNPWNTFQSQHAGQGLTRSQMSAAYRSSKNH